CKLPDDVRPQILVHRSFNPLDLGYCSQSFGIGFPFEPRTTERKAKRQNGQKIDERHDDHPITTKLSQVYGLVSQGYIFFFIGSTIPVFGDVHCLANRRNVSVQERCLESESPHSN